MGILRGIGRDAANQSSSVCKCSREEALLLGEPGTPSAVVWRRSALWLLIKVSLQLTLDTARNRDDCGDAECHLRPPHYMYKAFMVFFLSSILKKSAATSVSHNLLFFMKAKINQRLVKLGLVEGGTWYAFPRSVLQDIESTLAERWVSVQSPAAHALDFSKLHKLDFRRDTHITLRALRPYLDKTLLDVDWEQERGNKIYSPPFCRTKGEDYHNGVFQHDKEITLFELADFENWSQSHLKRCMSLRVSGDARPALDHQREEVEEGADKTDGQSRKIETRAGMVESEIIATDFRGDRVLDSGWLRLVDNEFARKLWVGTETRPVFPYMTQEQKVSSQMCEECKAVPVFNYDFERFVSPPQLDKTPEACELCGMLRRALWPPGTFYPVRPVRLYREGTNLWADGNDQPLLRMCASPEWVGDNTIQVGLPTFPERSSHAFFELLLGFLRDCDGNHTSFGCCRTSSTGPKLPTRIIDVGNKDQKGNWGPVRLVIPGESDRSQYLALSHHWGRPTQKENALNCAFKSNLASLCQGIDVSKLGKTFQDAITVTRRLGQRYIWIDSLCILQDEDDKDDWEREAKRMGDIFSSAHCVLAATAATGRDSGFLTRSTPSQFLTVPTLSGSPLYVCESVDDFRADVERAILSRRGWVLQERALARRTIYFSTGQTYFECGRGIRCESLALLKK